MSAFPTNAGPISRPKASPVRTTPPGRSWRPSAAIDRSRLTPSEQVNYDLLRRRLERHVRRAALPRDGVVPADRPPGRHRPGAGAAPGLHAGPYGRRPRGHAHAPAGLPQGGGPDPRAARQRAGGRDHAAPRDPARRARAGREPARAREPRPGAVPQAPRDHPRRGPGAAPGRGRPGLRRAGGAGPAQAPRLPRRDLRSPGPRVDRHERPAGRRGPVRLNGSGPTRPPT